MKRWIIYLLILGAVVTVPVERTDVAQLEPVEEVCLRVDGDRVVLETDTGDAGYGEDAQQALAQLHATAAGVIYLDTARYLLVTSDAQTQIPQLAQELKPKVRLYTLDGAPDLTEVSRYLENHDQGVTLEDWKPEQSLPVLWEREGRMWIKNN